MNVNLRKFTLLFTACLTLCCVGSPRAFGQPPSLINFRGQLLDSGGQPVNASVAVELRIFSSATGGMEIKNGEIFGTQLGRIAILINDR